MQYEIQSKSGLVFGAYEGATPEDAFAAMVADAGESGGAEGTADDWIIRPVVDVARYTWRTDAASGTLLASDVDNALARLVAEKEWAEMDSARETRDIADGAWLTLWDERGLQVLSRGTMP